MSKVLSGDGGFDEIRAAVPLLAEHADPVAHPEALPWLLTTPLFLRDAESGADLRRIVDAVRSRMGVGLLPNVLFHVARDQATSTAWSRATANYEEGIRLARETGQGTDLAMSLAGLAWLESRQGRGDACRSHASEAVGLCTERGIRMGEVWCLFALGDLQLAEGDARAATATFLDLSRRLEEWGIADPDLSPGAELVDALLRVGRTADAGGRGGSIRGRCTGEGPALVVGPCAPGRGPGGRRRFLRRALRRRARRPPRHPRPLRGGPHPPGVRRPPAPRRPPGRRPRAPAVRARVVRGARRRTCGPAPPPPSWRRPARR